jgi:hypothetical protein
VLWGPQLVSPAGQHARAARGGQAGRLATGWQLIACLQLWQTHRRGPFRCKCVHMPDDGVLVRRVYFQAVSGT